MALVNSLPFYLLLSVFINLTTCASLNETNEEWPIWSYKSSNANPPFMNITKFGPTEPGYIVTAPTHLVTHGGYPTIYDTDGELVWQGPRGNITYFRPEILHGEQVLIYWSGMATRRGFGSGAFHVLNSAYEEIYRMTLGEDEGLVSWFPGEEPKSYIDLQDGFVTERGTILVGAVNVTHVDRDAPPGVEWVLDYLFYEIDIVSNRVLFRWSALEHPDVGMPAESLKPVSGLGTTKEEPWDFIHLNGFAPYGDGYLISANYMRSLYAIGKDGAVQWKLSVRAIHPQLRSSKTDM